MRLSDRVKCWVYGICTRHLESKDQPLGDHHYGCFSCETERSERKRDKKRKIEDWIAALQREQAQRREGE